jgi:aryl-alcohol dehydrogenase-like predicted oxidoreductase
MRQILTNTSFEKRSFWTLTGSPSLLNHPSLIALSKRKQLTPAQSVYLFARSLGITPISGTTNVEHMEQDVELEKILGGDELEFAELKTFIWG